MSMLSTLTYVYAPCLQTCCIADFPVGRPSFVMALADLEIRDTAGLETCATSSYLRPSALSASSFFRHSDFVIRHFRGL